MQRLAQLFSMAQIFFFPLSLSLSFFLEGSPSPSPRGAALLSFFWVTERRRGNGCNPLFSREKNNNVSSNNS